MQGCPARVQAKHAHAHRTNLCPKRLVVCSNPNCWKKLMANNRKQHEVFECRYSKQWCPVGCKKYILRFELQSHIDNRCPERQVECRCAGRTPILCCSVVGVVPQCADITAAPIRPSRHCHELVKGGNLEVHENETCWMRPPPEKEALSFEDQEALRWKQLRAMKASKRADTSRAQRESKK